MPFDERNRILIGDGGAAALARATVAVYGLGGVGGACALDLVRAGVGRLLVLDFDVVKESNLNRLAYGTRANLGMRKTAAFGEYARAVNPAVEVVSIEGLVTGEGAAGSVPAEARIVVDAIDTLNPKINLIEALLRAGRVFVSSMGMAGRLDPGRLRVADFWETRGCPLAAWIRSRLRKRGLELPFPCVFSDEPPVKPVDPALVGEPGGSEAGRVRMVQGSMPFVPQAAGHMLASWTVRRLLSATREG